MAGPSNVSKPHNLVKLIELVSPMKACSGCYVINITTLISGSRHNHRRDDIHNSGLWSWSFRILQLHFSNQSRTVIAHGRDWFIYHHPSADLKHIHQWPSSSHGKTNCCGLANTYLANQILNYVFTARQLKALAVYKPFFLSPRQPLASSPITTCLYPWLPHACPPDNHMPVPQLSDDHFLTAAGGTGKGEGPACPGSPWPNWPWTPVTDVSSSRWLVN